MHRRRVLPLEPDVHVGSWQARDSVLGGRLPAGLAYVVTWPGSRQLVLDLAVQEAKVLHIRHTRLQGVGSQGGWPRVSWAWACEAARHGPHSFGPHCQGVHASVPAHGRPHMAAQRVGQQGHGR